MKKFLFSIIISLAFISVPQMKAQEFFDTSDASTFFSFSARLGFNTSNKTFPSGHFNLWNKNSWGTGVNLGVLANLNFKDYLTLQPGIFFESRSGDFAYLTEYLDYTSSDQKHYEMGHWRGYYITIPVMGVVNFNITERLKWMVELGPYFQYAMKLTGQDNVVVLYRLPQNNQYSKYVAQPSKWDVGIKMGSGLRFFEHYYVGVHYLAGICNTWKMPSGGKNKSWEFTLGYDF